VTVKILFVNEGDSRGTRGQGRFESIIRRHAPQWPGVSPAFMTLQPLSGRWLRAASGLAHPLWRRDLDLQAARWHAIQALRARAALAHVLSREPADVLHIHPHTAALALGGAAELPPFLVSVDAEIWDWRQMAIWQEVRPWSRAAISPSLLAQRTALDRAGKVLAWTSWAADGVRRAAPSAHVVVQHPGLDLKYFRPGERRDAAGEVPFRILFVGARFVRKGGQDLLAAVRPWLDSGVARLDIVTPDELPDRPGVTVHRLTGADPRLLQLFRASDCLCLPSYGDAAPWVVLEAMACGLPVVASRVGAIPDFLDDGRAGIVVAPGDVRDLRGALASLMADRARARDLGAAARARCEEHYDARRNTARLIDLAQEIAGPRGRRNDAVATVSA
jgi:alpha-maltose-1-phosphate synthase